MFTDFGQFLKVGGLPVYAMIGLAIFAVAVSFERIQSLYFNYSVDSEAFMKHVKGLILSDKMEEAIAYCTNSSASPFSVFRVAISSADAEARRASSVPRSTSETLGLPLRNAG